MGRKKGGAKNKLARMSEEERARYLQHRADIEEEARRRKQQLIALYMKNKLKREDAFSRLNLAKINQEWRSILRQIKTQELKKEVQEVEKLFQESLKQKSQIIQRYLNDLDEAEEIYANLSQSQMENVDKIIDLQNERMDYFKDRYIEEKEMILQECREDFKSYKQARSTAHIQLECVYFALDDVGETNIHEIDENHLNKMDILQSEMNIKLETITKSREEQLELLWKEYQKILDDYVKYTESFYAEYNELRERDEINTQLIRSHCYEVAKATDEVADLKIIADNTAEEYEFQIQYLEKYRNSLNEKFLGMKKDLEDKIKYDENEFRHMTVASHDTLKSLEKIYKKVQLVLQLVGVCRRLETEREKVMPFGHPKKDAFERPTITEDMKSPPTEIKDKILENWCNMENFWVRVNKVTLDTACLQEEKSFLENENEQLKAQLKNYLIHVTIATGPSGVMDERLMFRPNSMKVEKVVHIDLNKPATAMVQGREYSMKKRLKRRPVTCIEANLSNAVRSSKIVESRSNTVRYSYGKIGNVVNSW